MIKKRFPYIVIVILVIGLSVMCANAQETEDVQGQEQIEFMIDEALDLLEESIDQKGEEIDQSTLLKLVPAVDEQDSVDSAQDVPVRQVEVLDDVDIFDAMTAGNEAQETIPVPQLDTKVIPLLHAEASSIIETLEQMKGPEGIVSYNGEDRTLIIKDEPEQLEAMSAYVKKVDILLETEIFQLKFVNAQDCLEAIETILTKNIGELRINNELNSIVATDTPIKIGEITELIESLDYLNKAFEFKAKTLQIILNDEHIDGVDWEAIVSEFQSFPFPGFTYKTQREEIRKLNLGFVTQEDYEILLEALDTVGVVHQINDEIITAENEATQQLNISSSEGQGSADLLFDQAQREIVRYNLTPVVEQNELVNVEVTPVLVGDDDAQVQNASNESTVIQVESGATIVIGSLFNEVMVESSWKVPLLGDLPLLGFVFRNQGEVPRKTEFITFLTVRTVEK